MEGRIEKFKKIMEPCKERVSSVALDWLIGNDFFIAPASINHHGAYTGGLFEHSLVVTEQLLKLTKQLDLKWTYKESPYIVGMFHDLCKTDNYQCMPNGQWEYKNETSLPGHGDKSVILALRLLHLTDEEILCIRWHMGAFDNKEKWNAYSRAVARYTNVLHTHTADMIATHIIGI
jgi:23S rRNA maturation-related 3'-5' exoribonuclease YhaM